MRSDKNEAFKLRKAGKSFRDISQTLGVAKSTLSLWFRNVDFSDDVKRQLIEESKNENSRRIKALNKTRGVALRVRYELAREEAYKDLEKHKNNPLFISAIVAYWGEGDKRSKNHVRITNTDPTMLALFREFLTSMCAIPENKIKGALFLYEDLNSASCTRYWKKHTGIRLWHKPMVLPSRSTDKKLPYGICTLIVSNTILKQKMLVWIDQLPKMVLNKGSK